MSNLRNCTLTNNGSSFGGGAAFSLLAESLVISNRADTAGGGTEFSVLTNCILFGNRSAEGASGALGGTLNNCTLVYNNHGGADGSVLTNSIAVDNNDWYAVSSYFNCCTRTLPPIGSGNFTNDPLFIDATARNLRLQSNSPCINSGINNQSTGAVDLDGNPRIVAGTIDVGAYEFQSPASIISYAWLQQYFLPIDGSADYADVDGDGHNNWQEWIVGTTPTNNLSVLKILSVDPNSSGAVVTWQSVTNRNYFVQRAANLSNPSTFSIIQSSVGGQAGTTSFVDAGATNSTSFLYRIGVSAP
jgi:hypothetical protein